jgi:hypothetical protein
VIFSSYDAPVSFRECHLPKKFLDLRLINFYWPDLYRSSRWSQQKLHRLYIYIFDCSIS